MFALLCCADLEGEKVNLEVTLDNFPSSLPRLLDDLSYIFSCEVEALASSRNSGKALQPFQIMGIYIYDDLLLHWTKFKSLTQLHQYDQLYISQPETQWHVDVQKELPPPRRSAFGQAHSIVQDSATLASSKGEDGASSLWRNHEDRTHSPAMANTHAHQKIAPICSPVRAQLEEQRREEERLAHRLSLVRSERLRLEREAQREEEKERRQRALETDRLLKSKEEEIRSKRDALSRAEEEFRLFLLEKQRMVDQSASLSGL